MREHAGVASHPVDRLTNSADRLIDRGRHPPQFTVPRIGQVSRQIASRQRLHSHHAVMDRNGDAARDEVDQHKRNDQSDRSQPQCPRSTL